MRPSGRPTASFGLAQELALLPPADPAPAFPSIRELAPGLEVESVPPPVRVAPRRSRTRAVLSKLLFATLFAAVATLLGFAVKKKLDASGHSEDVARFLTRMR